MTGYESDLKPVLDFEQLLSVCSSRRWAELMASSGPFGTHESLLQAADAAFDQLGRDDWLEGIAGHARIAEPPAGDGREAREQSGMADADASTVAELHTGNRAYEERHGYIFLIRASGRSAAEMLAALKGRIDNPPEIEFAIATEQLREITLLRLRDLAI